MLVERLTWVFGRENLIELNYRQNWKQATLLWHLLAPFHSPVNENSLSVPHIRCPMCIHWIRCLSAFSLFFYSLRSQCLMLPPGGSRIDPFCKHHFLPNTAEQAEVWAAAPPHHGGCALRVQAVPCLPISPSAPFPHLLAVGVRPGSGLRSMEPLLATPAIAKFLCLRHPTASGELSDSLFLIGNIRQEEQRYLKFLKKMPWELNCFEWVQYKYQKQNHHNTKLL